MDSAPWAGEGLLAWTLLSLLTGPQHSVGPAMNHAPCSGHRGFSGCSNIFQQGPMRPNEPSMLPGSLSSSHMAFWSLAHILLLRTKLATYADYPQWTEPESCAVTYVSFSPGHPLCLSFSP